MLTFDIHIPLWFILGYSALCATFLFVSGVGIYYLISKKYDKVILIVAALLFLVLLGPKSLNPFYWAEFVRLLLYSLFYPESLIERTLIFSAIFGGVNFIHRFTRKRTLR